ncbi:MAG: hypothetical protein LC798_15420 [Chloroflexi bacterium]|nr:hypothetical protein [Chloroflexota bacterium]
MSNAPVRRLFEASSLTAVEVARRLGWQSRGGNGTRGADGVRVEKTLGLRDEYSHGCVSRRALIDAETAELLAEAMGYGRWQAYEDDEPVA